MDILLPFFRLILVFMALSPHRFLTSIPSTKIEPAAQYQAFNGPLYFMCTFGFLQVIQAQFLHALP